MERARAKLTMSPTFDLLACIVIFKILKRLNTWCQTSPLTPINKEINQRIEDLTPPTQAQTSTILSFIMTATLLPAERYQHQYYMSRAIELAKRTFLPPVPILMSAASLSKIMPNHRRRFSLSSRTTHAEVFAPFDKRMSMMLSICRGNSVCHPLSLVAIMDVPAPVLMR